MGLTDLRDKLNAGLVQLQDAYSKFNTVDSQIAPKQALVDGFKKGIDALTAKADANRQEIPLQKLQLNEINSQIALLEGQYKNALSKRSVYDVNIQKLNQSVASYDAQIAIDQKGIDDADA